VTTKNGSVVSWNLLAGKNVLLILGSSGDGSALTSEPSLAMIQIPLCRFV
jgi:hypothetical protein